MDSGFVIIRCFILKVEIVMFLTTLVVASLSIRSGGSSADVNDEDLIEMLFAAFSAPHDNARVFPQLDAGAGKKAKKARYSEKQETIVNEFIEQNGHLSNYIDMYLKLVPMMNSMGLDPMSYESFYRRARARKGPAGPVQRTQEMNLAGIELSTILENLLKSDPSISPANAIDIIKSKGYTFSPKDVRNWFAFKKFLRSQPNMNQITSSAVIQQNGKDTSTKVSSTATTGKRKISSP